MGETSRNRHTGIQVEVEKINTTPLSAALARNLPSGENSKTVIAAVWPSSVVCKESSDIGVCSNGMPLGFFTAKRSYDVYVHVSHKKVFSSDDLVVFVILEYIL